MTIYLHPASHYGPNSYLSESLSCNNNSIDIQMKAIIFEENYQ